VRTFVTGGTGVLGRHTIPVLEETGHQVDAPGRADLDLFDPEAVRAAVAPADAVLHLATRIPPPEARGEHESWVENDRLRGEGTPILVRAAMDASASLFLMPTVAFVYPPGPSDESTPIRYDLPYYLETAVAAEQAVAGFTGPGRRGIVLRFGLLYGPDTGSDAPDDSFGSTLEIGDAARATVAALDAPAGTYNVVADGEPVSNSLFRQATGWAPTDPQVDAR
jgi:2-alkyl-3-oxoalkanoate reductase